MKKFIDLNCDMGESFGAWKMGNDAAIMPFISSANIACGFHAGDPATISKTVELAIENDVAIGAHPSYPDLEGFGRRKMDIAAKEIYSIVLYQISAVKGICESKGTALHHVKPHGALYNSAAADKELARAIAEAVRDTDPALILYGLSGSHLIAEAERIGLRVANEVFADRTYQADGSLTARSEANALIENTGTALEQVSGMVQNGLVKAIGGEDVGLEADTVCIHGDGPHALEFAKAIRGGLESKGIAIRAV